MNLSFLAAGSVCRMSLGYDGRMTLSQDRAGASTSYPE